MPIDFVLTPELQRSILALASQADIHSISCPFDEFELWHGLLTEQVRRSRQLGKPPQEALCLIGPDSGIPGITPIPLIDEDGTLPPEPDPRTGGLAPQLWGGKVHIPYENTCGADLFILPKWHNVFPDRVLRLDAKLYYLVGGRKCNYLLTNRDLGDFPCATRRDCGGWFLYKSNGPYMECNPFHQNHRLL